MGNMDYQATILALKNEVTRLALSSVQNYKNEAKADGLKLVDSLKVDIQNWSKQLAEGKLSADDLEFLVMAKKEVIEMDALKQVGLGMIKVDEFKSNVLQLIVKSLVGVI